MSDDEKTCATCQYWAHVADLNFCQRDGEESQADDWCEAWEMIGTLRRRADPWD
jgi:hypothetical protein